MAVRKKIPYQSGIFFITFTCAHWIPLFEITNGYHFVYKFFDTLKSNGHFINAYVIMPDHVHAILSFTYSEKSINRVLGDGKRFITYDFVDELNTLKNVEFLEKLSGNVNVSDRKKGKLHEAFEPSFDWKECYSDDFIEQKLNYIHMNPCVCDPPLAKIPIDYLHSSANFYLGGNQIIYPVEHIMNMKDINFDKKANRIK
jgi:hypothetical protein